MLAKIIIKKLEIFHNKGYVHRDIKPGNFVTGLGKQSTEIFLIDYGLTQTFIESNYTENVSFVGNSIFMSLNSHFGIGTINN